MIIIGAVTNFHCANRNKLMINKDDFLLSVIIPVYNEEATIKEILDSVIWCAFSERNHCRG